MLGSGSTLGSYDGEIIDPSAEREDGGVIVPPEMYHLYTVFNTYTPLQVCSAAIDWYWWIGDHDNYNETNKQENIL